MTRPLILSLAALLAPSSAFALEVLVVSNYAADLAAADLSAQMTSAPTPLVFSSWDAYSTPTPADLDPYDVVVIFEDGTYDNAVEVGSAVYDWYATGGRGVVTGTFYTQGRSDSEYGVSYGTLEDVDALGAGDNGCDYDADTLDPATIVSHYVTTGVTSLYAASYRGDTEAVNGSTVLAAWSTPNQADGVDPVVAVNETMGSRSVGVSVAPQYAVYGTYGSEYSGDFYTLFQNAIVWAGFEDCADVDGDGEQDASCGGTDCDDAVATVNTAATESCDAVDNDCDGTVDEPDASDASVWYADADADTYGDAAQTLSACAAPDGYVGDDTDCDDGAATVYPGATEVVADGVDQDCDGVDLCYEDADEDGYRSDDGSTIVGVDLSCDEAGMASGETPAGDCDDGDATAFPGAEDPAGDDLDQDCDGADSVEAEDSGEVDGDGAADDEADDQGCGCAAGGADGAAGVGALAGLAMIAGIARRRRG